MYTLHNDSAKNHLLPNALMTEETLSVPNTSGVSNLDFSITLVTVETEPSTLESWAIDAINASACDPPTGWRSRNSQANKTSAVCWTPEVCPMQNSKSFMAKAHGDSAVRNAFLLFFSGIFLQLPETETTASACMSSITACSKVCSRASKLPKGRTLTWRNSELGTSGQAATHFE